MQETFASTSDRMVVVSSSVQALDKIQGLCKVRNWATQRIDGSTAASLRQDIVNNFNLHGVGQVSIRCFCISSSPQLPQALCPQHLAARCF